MAVKIFCNCCQNFIRDAKPSEIPSLKGTEICKDCETKMNKSIEEIIAISNRAKNHIDLARDQAKQEMEEARRRIIESEVK